MAAAVLALTSSLAWGLADFGAGLASRRRSVLTVMALSSAAALPVVAALVALRGDPFFGWSPAVYAALAAVSGTTGIAAFYRGLAVGSMSVVAPISSTGAAIPVAYGLATGDRPSAWQGVGVALALVGVALASRQAAETAEAGRSRTATGVGLALIAAVGFGGFFVGIDAASDANPWWAILVQRASGLALVAVAVLVARPSLAVRASEGATLAMIGILDMLANLLFALASARGLISLVGLLGSLYPVVTVLLARGVLRERLRGLQWAGVGLALVGVGLIGAG